MKKCYEQPSIDAHELKTKSNLLEWSATTDNSGSGNGGTTTGGSDNNPTIGGDDGDAAAKGTSWSLFE